MKNVILKSSLKLLGILILALSGFTSRAQFNFFIVNASQDSCPGNVQVSIEVRNIGVHVNKYVLFRDGVQIDSAVVNSNNTNHTFTDRTVQRDQMHNYCVYFKATDGSIITDRCDYGYCYTPRKILSVSDGAGDGYLNFEYAIPFHHIFLNNNLQLYTYLQILDDQNNKEIFVTEIDTPSIEVYQRGNFRILIDTNSGPRSYSLNLFKIGPGTLLSSATDVGYTTPLKGISNAVSVVSPGKISLSWTNNTDHDTIINIYRNGNFLATRSSIQGINHFEDSVDRENTNTILNDGSSSYTYEIEYNEIRFPIPIRYPKQVIGSSEIKLTPINLQASDNVYTDSILLSWNDMSSYCSRIVVYRDGIRYARIPGNSVKYWDKWPVYGKKHEYLLSLENQVGTEISFDSDFGSVETIGFLDGWVRTSGSDTIGFGDVLIELEFIENGDTLKRRTRTDQSGYYKFDKLYFGRENTLTVSYVAESNLPLIIETTSYELNFNRNRSIHRVDFIVTEQFTRTQENIDITFLTHSIYFSDNGINLFCVYREFLNTDSLVAQVFRDGVLIHSRVIPSDETDRSSLERNIFNYSDFNGIPGKRTLYKIVLYSRSGTEVAYISKQVAVDYPQVYAPSNFQTSSSGKGFTNLTWSSIANNFDGFQLLRSIKDSTKIDTIGFLNTNARSFDDMDGLNGVNYVYGLVAYIKRYGKTYYSNILNSEFKYDELESVSNFIVDTLHRKNQTILRWTYEKAPSFNYDGFVILRNGLRIAEVDKSTGRLSGGRYNFQYEDLEGKPDTTARYSIKALKNKMRSTSDAQIARVEFPVVSKPNNLEVTQQKINSTGTGLLLAAITDNSENIDGKLIEDRTGRRIFIEAGSKEVLFAPGFTGGLISSVHLYNFRIQNGDTIYSDRITDNVIEFLPSPTLTVSPGSVEASDDIANQIRISWTYPTYVHAEFEVYRDGELVTRLGTNSRVFFDQWQGLKPGRRYVYQVQAVLNDNGEKRSGKPGDIGVMYSSGRLRGVVQTQDGGLGIPGAKVTLRANILENSKIVSSIKQEAETDSSGYYEISNVDNFRTNRLTVGVSKQNEEFSYSDTVVILPSDRQIPEINFYALSDEQTEFDDGVSSILSLSGSYNLDSHWVEVRWIPENTNFDGFEFYLGLVKVATIYKGSPMRFEHKDGTPGFKYRYGVRAFKDYPEGVQYSGIVGGLLQFPGVLPVEYLNAEPRANEDVVRLTWSHKTNNVNFYEVRRDGIVLARLDARTTDYTFTDTSGRPDQSYEYSVTAFKVVGSREVKSETRSASTRFPAMSRITTISSLHVPNGIRLRWDHETENIEGYRIYRDGVRIAVLDLDSLDVVRRFTDYTAFPGNTHHYLVEAFDYRGDPGEEQMYLSRPIEADFEHLKLRKTDPVLVNVGVDSALITWHYDSKYLGLDGFRVTRVVYIDGVRHALESGFVKRADSLQNGMYKFLDPNANSVHFELAKNHQFKYEVRAMSMRESREYLSDSVEVLAELGNIQKPDNPNVTLIPNSTGVTITWQHRSLFNDGFEILESSGRGLKRIAMVSKGIRRYEVYNNNLDQSDNNIIYWIRAVRYLPTPGGGLDTFYSENTFTPAVKLKNAGYMSDLPLPEVASGYRFEWRSVAIDGDRIAAGYKLTNGIDLKRRGFLVWHLEEDEWVIKSNQDWDGNSAGDSAKKIDGQFGESIDIKGDWVVVGYPKYIIDTKSIGIVEFFKYDAATDRYSYKQTIASHRFNRNWYNYDGFNFGSALELTDDFCLVGIGGYDWINGSNQCEDCGMVLPYYLDPNDNWDFVDTTLRIKINSSNYIWKLTPSEFEALNELHSYSANVPVGVGNSVATDGKNIILCGFDGSGGNTIAFYKIHPDKRKTNTYGFQYHKEGGSGHNNYNVVFNNSIDLGQTAFGGELLTTSHTSKKQKLISLSGSHAVWGAPDSRLNASASAPPRGLVTFFTYANGKWKLEMIDSSDIENDYFLGAVVQLETDDKAMVMSHNKIYHWQYDKKWRRARVLPQVFEQHNPFETVGGFDAGTGVVANGSQIYVVNTVSPPDTVSASDGKSASVTVTWEYRSREPNSGFKVYRNGIEIAEVDARTRRYVDSELIPAKEYLYSVRSISENGKLSPVQSDRGYAKSAYSISGLVITAGEGSNGVPGVRITAQSNQINGEIFSFQTSTDQDGNFKLTNLYSGSEDSVIYTVEAHYPNHIFRRKIIPVLLTEDQSTGTAIFIDETAFTISGTVRSLANCPLDSVEIAFSRFYLDQVVSDTIFTDRLGKYNFTYNPTDPNLDSVVLHPLNSKFLPAIDSSGPRRMGNFYRLYSNGSGSVVLNDFSSVRISTIIDFVDSTAYQIDVFVRNTCTLIADVDSFRVLLESEDGCYRKIRFTNRQGKVEFPGLAAKKYNIKVIGAQPLNSKTEPIVNYLAARPSSLDLAKFHNRMVRELYFGIPPSVEVGDTFQSALVYHKLPTIRISGFNEYQCNDASKAVLLQQGETSSFNVLVSEYHNGQSCDVFEGFLVVKNEAATVTETYLAWDQDAGRWNIFDKADYERTGIKEFKSFEFVVGAPNPVSPHRKYIIVEYHTEESGFLGRTVQECIVEGIVATPGYDVVVNPVEDDAVPVPLHVLRDPPGDGSSAYLSKGVTFKRVLEDVQNHSGAIGVEKEFSFEPPFIPGLSIKGNLKLGGGTNNRDAYEFEVSVNEQISTASSSDQHKSMGDGWLDGEDADVIVGVGVAQQYGLSNKVAIDPSAEGCEPTSTQVMSFGLGEILTTWIYTMDQVQSLDSLYSDYATRAGNGEKEFQLEGFTQAEAARYFEVRADNWRKIKSFHDVTTNPKYYFCTAGNNITDGWADISKSSRQKIWKVVDPFCKSIGNYSRNPKTNRQTFVPFENKIWDQTQIDAYNGISIALRDEANYRRYEKYFDDNQGRDLQIEKIDLSIYGQDASNITFSGGTSYTKEITTKRAHTHEYTTEFNFNESVSVGLKWDKEVSMEKGLYAGSPFAGTILSLDEDITEFNSELDFIQEYSYKYTEGNAESIDSTNTIGFILSDDDPGDQFSVTVIKGIDPAYSPYFELVGGRSSCPFEDGTISRDEVQLELRIPGNPELVDYDHKRYLDPDSPAVYSLKITNRNPFNEPRWIELYIPSLSNRLNATLKVGGVTMGTRKFFIPANESIYVNLEVTRSPSQYQHLDLAIGAGPECDMYVGSELEIKAEWLSPCSQVSILNDNNWIINSGFNGDAEPLLIRLGDFELGNEKLDSISIQVRRVNGTDADRAWRSIHVASKNDLIHYDTSNRSDLFSSPVYRWDWDIDDYPFIVDGKYEMRAVAWCNVYGSIQSEGIFGTIDRDNVRLFGVPEPADGVLSRGDAVLVRFNESLDQGRQAEARYRFYISERPGDTTEIPAVATFNGELVIFNLENVNQYDRKLIRASLDRVFDINGNRNQSPVIWTFRVNNSAFSWIPEQVSERMVLNTQKNVPLFISNSFSIEEVYSISKSLNSSWLDVNQISGTVPIGGLSLNLTINTNGLEIDSVYRDTLVLRVSEIGEFTFRYLPVELRVYSIPPKWEPTVGGAAPYQESFVLQYRFKGKATSKDELDRIALLINNQVVGAGNIVRIPNATPEISDDAYYAFITVKGRQEHLNQPIECRVWHNESGKEYNGYPQTIHRSLFKFNGQFALKGTTQSPIVLEVDLAKDEARYFPIRQGYSWFSVPTRMDTMTIPFIFKSAKPNSVYQALTKYGGAQRNINTGKWSHLDDTVIVVNEAEGIDFIEVWSNTPDTLRITGSLLSVPVIPIDSGWNQIGVPGDTIFSVERLSFGADTIPTNQARIIGMDGGTIYDSAAGNWSDPVFNFVPGQGYMVNWAREDELILNKKFDDPDKWAVDPRKFQHRMVFVAMVRINGVMSLNEYDRVGAFVRGECRGVANLVYHEDVNRYMVFLTVLSNNPGELVEFKLLDWDQDLIFDAIQRFSFEPGGTMGYIWEPFIFSTGYLTGIPRAYTQKEDAVVYPNPFSDDLNIKLASPYREDVQVELLDQTGRILYAEKHALKKGEQIVQLNNLSAILPDGVYVLRVHGNHMLRDFKVVKVKH